MQKKENAKIREEIEFYERVIEKKQEEADEELDMENIDAKSNAYNVGMQSKISGRREMSAA